VNRRLNSVSLSENSVKHRGLNNISQVINLMIYG
jgi:hypothetical protein